MTQPYVANDAVTEVIVAIYQAPAGSWDAYEMAEKLVDVDETYSLWRYRHLKVVMRIIGRKRGTGGTEGAGYLRGADRRGVLPRAVGGAHGAARAPGLSAPAQRVAPLLTSRRKSRPPPAMPFFASFVAGLPDRCHERHRPRGLQISAAIAAAVRT